MHAPQLKKRPLSGLVTAGFIFALVIYLILRYTLFLSLFGIDIAGRAYGISESLLLSICVIVSFALFSYFVAYSRIFNQFLARYESTEKTLIPLLILLFVCATILLGIGKMNYGPYHDEIRDAVVSNLVTAYSIEVFTDNQNLSQVSDSFTVEQHHWAQRLHPPGHYVPAMVLPEGSYSITFYRFLYLTPIFLFGLLAIYYARQSRETQIQILVLGVLLFSASYFRNYTLIRYGNELFSFLGFSLMLIVVYKMMNSEKAFGIGQLGIVMLFFCAAVFSKFSALVAMIALIAGLILGALIYRNGRLVRLSFVLIGVLTAAFIVYFIVFDDTIMLQRHVASYQGRILQSLRIVDREDLLLQGITPEGRHMMRMFYTELPFKYGPVLCAAVTLFGASIVLRITKPRMQTVVLMLFLAFGILGVILVNPRAQYTAPLMLGIVFLVGTYLIDSFKTVPLMKLLLITFAFSTTEVLFMSYANVLY